MTFLFSNYASKLLAIFILHLCIAVPQLLAQYPVHEIVDTRMNNKHVANFVEDQNQPVPNPLAVGDILEYQLATGHFDPSLSPNAQNIFWTLDISNLGIISYINDFPKPSDPPQPLSMVDLAHFGGFDHFNFVQYVTGLPDDVEASISTGDERFDTDFPILDPILNHPSNTLHLYSARADRDVAVNVEGGSDNSIGYYETLPGSITSYQNFLTFNSYVFVDGPRIPHSFFTPPHPNDFLYFSTEFYGAYADGSTDENSFFEGRAPKNYLAIECCLFG